MKRKININYILAACAVVLALLCFLSIRKPMAFEAEQTSRETVVKEQLMHIRMAEEKFKQKHGAYTSNFDLLIKEGYLDKESQFIPFSNHKKFSLSASTQVSKSGKPIPLMECSALYEDYLVGLDSHEIDQLSQQANASGQFPGLKIGDITENSNNVGNWQ